MANSKFQICNEVVHPGEHAHLALQLPELHSCAPLFMPIKIIHGQQEGPCLLIFAGMHGNELNGIEIINELLEDEQLKANLHGTLIAVPILNVYGLTSEATGIKRYMDINQSFPGKQEGSFGERIAYIFTQEILAKADYCMELQTGGVNHEILPTVYCNVENRFARNLAKQFNAPVISNVKSAKHSIREACENLNIPLLVYQGGEAMRFDTAAIELGKTGLKNIMAILDMLQDHVIENEITSVFSQDQEWMLSPRGGVLHTQVELGQTVQEGDVLGLISDPFGKDLKEPVHANQEGIVVGINNQPLLFEGQTTYKIASFIDINRAESTLEEWDAQVQSNNEQQSD